MVSHGINSAFAVSLPNQSELDHQEFFYLANETPGLVPVAAVCAKNSPQNELSRILNIGYRHIKLHPRLLNMTLKSHFDFYNHIFAWAALNDVIVFLCTYNSWDIKKLADEDPINALGSLISNNPTGKYVLLHGGSTNLLRYYEYFRNTENVLLDLSYTMVHFRESTLFKDMKFLAKVFDTRLLVGSDYPDFSHSDFIESLKKLVSDLPDEKVENIIQKNWTKVRDGDF